MKRARTVVLALVLLGGFGCGVVWLFQFRFSTGDAYPAYSTLRVDPVGASVLFESLARLPGMTVNRNLMPLTSLARTGSTIFLLGLSPQFDSNQGAAELRLLESLASRGNRVVLAFHALDEGEELKTAELQLRWKVKLAHSSGLYLAAATGWTVLSRDRDHLLTVEKPFGKGSIVLAAYGPSFDNLSMAAGGDPALLARIVGPNRDIVFDETHLGIEESGSVVDLARRFRLHGLGFGLALCAALFLWRSTAAFPPFAGAPAPTGISGRTALAGMVTLLRRHVPVDELVNHCWQQWLKGGAAALTPQRQARAEAIVRAGPRDPIPAMREIQVVLAARQSHAESRNHALPMGDTHGAPAVTQSPAESRHSPGTRTGMRGPTPPAPSVASQAPQKGAQ